MADKLYLMDRGSSENADYYIVFNPVNSKISTLNAVDYNARLKLGEIEESKKMFFRTRHFRKERTFGRIVL